MAGPADQLELDNRVQDHIKTLTNDWYIGHGRVMDWDRMTLDNQNKITNIWRDFQLLGFEIQGLMASAPHTYFANDPDTTLENFHTIVKGNYERIIRRRGGSRVRRSKRRKYKKKLKSKKKRKTKTRRRKTKTRRRRR